MCAHVFLVQLARSFDCRSDGCVWNSRWLRCVVCGVGENIFPLQKNNFYRSQTILLWLLLFREIFCWFGRRNSINTWFVCIVIKPKSANSLVFSGRPNVYLQYYAFISGIFKIKLNYLRQYCTQKNLH